MTLKNITKTPFELPDEILRYLQDHSEMLIFRKNAVIVAPGETDVPLYFISAGLARIYCPPTSDNPREVTILFGEAGNIATSLSNFMLGLPAVFGVSAVTPVKVFKIPADKIRNLYQTNTIFCRWLMELSLLQLAHLEVRFTYHNSDDPYMRLINFIKFKPKSFMRRVPGYLIASYVGVSPAEYALMKERYDSENMHVEYDKEFLDNIGITGLAPED